PVALLPASQAAESRALPALPLDLRQWQNQQERDLVEASLHQARYNQRRAAGLLGVTYHQLRAMMKKHGIKAEN
ncbi:helix-turn-helix domain-containing protein, partial [Pantoea deleyi]